MVGCNSKMIYMPYWNPRMIACFFGIIELKFGLCWSAIDAFLSVIGCILGHYLCCRSCAFYCNISSWCHWPISSWLRPNLVTSMCRIIISSWLLVLGEWKLSSLYCNNQKFDVSIEVLNGLGGRYSIVYGIKTKTIP